MRLKELLFVLAAFCICQILAHKEDPLSYTKKFLTKEKDKLAQWTNVQKKTNLQKHQQVKNVKTKTKEDPQERARICSALSEESVPDFFLKFGLVTNLIDDIGDFQSKMKIQSPGWKRKKRLRGQRNEGESFGKPSDKLMAMKHKFGSKQKQVKSNHLHEKLRARHEGNHVPPCYGFNYLSSVDALLTDESGSVGPDVDTLKELMSDMADMKLMLQIANAFGLCQQETKNDTQGCPADFSVSSTTCHDTCVSDSDCATGELCCRTTCGGSGCLDPRFAAKYRHSDIGGQKCQGADRFLQCAYQKIKEKICD